MPSARLSKILAGFQRSGRLPDTDPLVLQTAKRWVQRRQTLVTRSTGALRARRRRPGEYRAIRPAGVPAILALEKRTPRPGAWRLNASQFRGPRTGF